MLPAAAISCIPASSIICRVADIFPVTAVQVVNGLTSLLSSGSSPNGNLSSLESYNTALTFVQALARTQDSNGNTTAVSNSNPAVSAARVCSSSGAVNKSRHCTLLRLSIWIDPLPIA